MPRIVRPVGLDPRLSSGMDANFGDASLDLYHPVNVYLPRSATPSSGYSFNLYDEYQASNHSGPSSKVDYFGASGFSTLTSDFSLPEPWAACGSGSNALFLPPNIIPSDGSASELTGTDHDFSPPPESSGFNADHPTLMTQEEMDEASEAWEWIPSDTIWLEKNVSSDFYIPPQPFPVTKNLKVVRLERVHGIPSQFPVPRVPTAYIINFSSVRDAYKDTDGEVINLEKILKDKNSSPSLGLPLLGWYSGRATDEQSSDGERAAVRRPRALRARSMPTGTTALPGCNVLPFHRPIPDHCRALQLRTIKHDNF
ncbi:hypothetical protein B0H14DRAFT_2644028 [Mycena olivaceomarginata]|nr:hypothetical protein B0H14DRAFT_2644028 [Mycena olivaceomarginata]